MEILRENKTKTDPKNSTELVVVKIVRAFVCVCAVCAESAEFTNS